jgi:hypothetical protein
MPHTRKGIQASQQRYLLDEITSLFALGALSCLFDARIADHVIGTFNALLLAVATMDQ